MLQLSGTLIVLMVEEYKGNEDNDSLSEEKKGDDDTY